MEKEPDDRLPFIRFFFGDYKDGCMECGACVKNCAFNAIEVKSGVGCAYSVIMGWLLGTEPTCDCSGDNSADAVESVLHSCLLPQPHYISKGGFPVL